MAVTDLALKETVVGPLRELVNKAPEIIHELNPVNWVRDCLNDSRSFRLARLKIQSETAIKVQQRDIILAEIAATEKMYVESRKNALQVLHEQRAVFFAELKNNEKSLNNDLEELQYYSKKIFSENIDHELRLMIFSYIHDIRKDIQATLDRIRAAADQKADEAKAHLQNALDAQNRNPLPSGTGTIQNKVGPHEIV